MWGLKQCGRLCLEQCWGGPEEREESEERTRNAKEAAGKVFREEGLPRRVPGGSAEGQVGGSYNHVRFQDDSHAEIFCVSVFV